MQVGVGPQHREIGPPISTNNASWGGAPTQRISKRNSTDHASWAPTFVRNLSYAYFLC
ncbi:hypothetical protein AB2Q56_07695 [Staphylococcus aureus]|uniref:hypothetical protein n=1 Tax=Staphylococcus aureus TaxID=1280 RepID=UPI0017F6F37A|nr:hypothetical protein [Staphylococcus aureus]MBB2574238.1 hypothetical protein [Staphylococcus aureus]MEC6972020.1 hypothetical protein [Staphylococcus aureus]HCZ9896187.1 hypothetical protein [Staphylococcus aureus]HDA0283661.1 hypothetical protein [Staphylococcus aureus]HDA0983997.1 hypothetical protein [Staphylococcus aureus]